MAVAGWIIGLIGASAGGAALLIAPALQAAGLRGDRYAGTGAACAAIFNGSRCIGYAAAGLYARSQLGSTAALATACVIGNLLGVAMRRRMDERAVHAIEVLAPLAAIAMSLVGG